MECILNFLDFTLLLKQNNSADHGMISSLRYTYDWYEYGRYEYHEIFFSSHIFIPFTLCVC